MDWLRTISTRVTPQAARIPGSAQVANSAGGYSWAVDDLTRLRRFLILGTDGGSYYATPQALTVENAAVVRDRLAADGPGTVEEIVAISRSGRATRQQPAIFALAMAAGVGDDDTRARALAALPLVCRTGTHLFLFAGYVEQFRGWGRGLRRAVASWYVGREPDALALQLVKYQQREGWSHRDLLRLAKPAPVRDSPTDLALRWAVGKLDLSSPEAAAAPRLLHARAAATAATSDAQVAALVAADALPWEALASERLASAEVWAAMLPGIGLTALLRNLGRLTTLGVLAPGGPETALVVDRLTDAGALRRARVRPIAVLSALLTYRSGRGVRGSLSWAPVPAVLDALDVAFHASFGTVQPAGVRTLLALDVSGSMGTGSVGGVPGLTPRVASAALAMVAVATEPSVSTVAFTSGRTGAWRRSRRPARTWRDAGELSALPFSARQRLDDAVAAVSGLPFGGTDCALPMLYALDRGLEVDSFVVYTDSETWHGDVHPVQALRRYRERTGIPARLTVVGMVSNGFTIADPADAGMLDVVGFDTATPQLMADFAAGRL